MTKEELKQEADKFVSEKADKGNFDLEQFGIAYFSENSVKQALIRFTEQRKVCTEIEINRELEEEKCELLGIIQDKDKAIQDLQKENAELKADNDARKFAMAMSEKVEKQLREENAELKSLKDVADLIRLNNSHIVAMAQLNNNNVALRKENAELKEARDNCESCRTLWDDNFSRMG